MSIKGFDKIVESCSPWEGYTFDPLHYIQAVNYLYTSSEADLIAAFKEYVRPVEKKIVQESTKVFFLLRLLFEPVDPAARLPIVAVGKPTDEHYPSSMEGRPLYPLVLIRDVPLLIVSGFFLGGVPEDPIKHIEFCERNCRVRSRPLTPPDNPLSLGELLPQDRGMLRAQLLRLTRKVYPVQGAFELTFYRDLSQDSVWQQHKQAFEALHAVWDQKENNYRRL